MMRVPHHGSIMILLGYVLLVTTILLPFVNAASFPSVAGTSTRSMRRNRHFSVVRQVAFALPSSLALQDEMTLWAIRVASASLSYVGFVTYLDRPRGILNVGQEVAIRPSTVPGAGLGLFATMAMPKHTVLGTYPGVVLPLSQNLNKLRMYPSCEGYIWRFSDNRFVIDPTNAVGVLDTVCYGGNPSLPGSTVLFQTLFQSMTVPTTLCRINEPPRGKDVNVVTEEDQSRRCVTFLLERDVYPGEELFIDYGLSYDRSIYGRVPSSSNDEDV